MAAQAEALQVRQPVRMAAILERHDVVCFFTPYFDTAPEAVSAERAGSDQGLNGELIRLAVVDALAMLRRHALMVANE